MKGFGLHSGPAAFAMMGHSTEYVARAIGVTEAALEAALEAGEPLPKSAHRRFRALLWRFSMVMIDGPLIEGAFHIRPLSALRTWARFAEMFPDSRNDGLAFTIFAKAWRAWLRATGHHHRIGWRTRFASEAGNAGPAHPAKPVAGTERHEVGQ